MDIYPKVLYIYIYIIYIYVENPKVYDVINWLIKNTFSYLYKEIRSDIDLLIGRLIGYLVRKIFKEKVYRKSALMLFNFGK